MSETKLYKGLSAAEADESRRLHGVNILTPPERESLWQRFAKKFSDPLVIILLVAGVLSVGISCYEYWGLDEGGGVFFEPVGIFIAIFLPRGLPSGSSLRPTVNLQYSTRSTTTSRCK